MKIFFFDLDETLFVNEHRLEKLTVTQCNNLDRGENNACIVHFTDKENTSSGMIGLYATLHHIVFQYLSLTRNDNYTFIVTDSSYSPTRICQWLTKMFHCDHFFSTIPIFNRNMYPISVSKGTRVMHILGQYGFLNSPEWRSPTLPRLWSSAIAPVRNYGTHESIGSNRLPYGVDAPVLKHCYLIDNSFFHRNSAAYYGIQAVDPTKEDYPEKLKNIIFFK
ncbi:hypothetical protein [Endozoicomonas lisbonensis]